MSWICVQASTKLANRLRSTGNNGRRSISKRTATHLPVGLQHVASVSYACPSRDCEVHGGTWGYNDGQTVHRVDAATATGLFAQLQTCYFLVK